MAKIKVADEKLTGEEPTYVGNISRTELAFALNWYNYYSDAKNNMKWVYDWMKDVGYSKADIDRLKSCTSTQKNQNLASMARILARGATNIDLVVSLQARIKTLLDMTQEEVVEAIAPTKKAPPEISNPLVADLDDLLDVFYRSEYKTIQDPVKLIDGRSASDMASAQAYYKELLDEVQQHATYLKSIQKNRYLKQVESILDCLGVAKANTQRRKVATRKPRAKKVLPATKVVEKLQFASDSAQYNAASIDPVKILESTVLYVFNTEYRELTVFIAKTGERLSVKGTSIVNYDEANSFTIKLRKPSEIIPDILTLAKKPIEKRISDLSTKKSLARPRINKKQLLLRSFK